jgi:hypothetical protein
MVLHEEFIYCVPRIWFEIITSCKVFILHPIFAGMEPVSVTDTNLNITMNLEAKLGESLVIFCKSQGKPEPTTKWFKVSSAFSIF